MLTCTSQRCEMRYAAFAGLYDLYYHACILLQIMLPSSLHSPYQQACLFAIKCTFKTVLSVCNTSHGDSVRRVIFSTCAHRICTVQF